MPVKCPKAHRCEALDIGVGANRYCIYPLLGYSDTTAGAFLGSDIDPVALASAKAIVQANGLGKAITLRQQANRAYILSGLLQDDDRFDLTLLQPALPCLARGSHPRQPAQMEKPRQAGPQAQAATVLNFGGQNNGLWCEGGEIRFCPPNWLAKARSTPSGCCGLPAWCPRPATCRG